MEDFATYELPKNALDGSFARLDGHIWRSQGRQGDGTPKGCETRNVTVIDNANLSFGPQV
jgi:hypothetical protein